MDRRQDLIFGIHAVDEAVNAGERLRRLHVASDRARDPVIARIAKTAREAGIEVVHEGREYFARLPFKAHQGIVAEVPPFAYASLHTLIASAPRGTRKLIVVMDHVTDPHNLGAIVRTAEAVGADGVVIAERRAAGITASARKAAAGATAHLPIAQVANISDAIRTLKKAGIWVYGADAGATSSDMSDADFDRDLALVIGAEDGLSQLVARECDVLVRIPILGRVESLNASVAAAVLLYEAIRQRRN